MLSKKDNYYLILNDDIIKYVLYFVSIEYDFYNLIKNKNIFNYGIDIIHHIFNFILLYTKNLYLTLTYTKNAYIYYIEFMEQINSKNNLFLKLKKEDAALFIYKKTIFNIEKKHLINNKKDNKLIYIYYCTKLVNLLIKKMININKNDNFYKNIKKEIKKMYKDDKSIIENINIVKNLIKSN